MQNGDLDQPERPEPRDAGVIFDDLRTLAQSDGALHSLSSLFYRDWVLKVDTLEGRVVDEADKRWSITKLNNNEIMLLLGLIVQADSDRIYSVVPTDEEFSIKADIFLREFHDRVNENARSKMYWSDPNSIKGDEAFGPMSQEAIYYGADGFYVHQFERLSRLRYRNDGDWLLESIGLSIRPMLDIARFIIDRINQHITAAIMISEETVGLSPSDMTNSLIISKADLIGKFGQKAEAFLSKFSIPAVGSNLDFSSPFDINLVNFSPLIDIGDFIYVSNQYRLFASIYESPFYWMFKDKEYRNKAAEHRGDFLENNATHQLRSIFGDANVFQNVIIRRSRKEIAGEADALVAYGEFVLVVQAKSKRVTQEARAGNVDALKADFESAIQAPYHQAYEFAELILSGAECEIGNGVTKTFPPTVRVFPVVLLSDHFPATTFLSNFMLKRKAGIAPVIWDLGMLDAVASILPTPIEFLFYLKSRADTFEAIHSDSEFNFLGYHLCQKLVLPVDADWLLIDRDFAGTIDDFMIMRDMKEDAVRPVGILERIDMPVITELLKALKTAPPELASVVIDLYDFSSTMLEELSKTILSLREEVGKGKAFKSFSVLSTSGGLTYLVCSHFDARVKGAAEAVGKKHKYDQKCDRWYVVVDSIRTKRPIDALLPILGKWEEDEELAAMSDRVESMFGSRRQNFVVGENFKNTERDQGSEGDE
jgi:hypothetical protein